MTAPRESLALTIATAIEVQASDSVIPAVVTPFDRHIADAVIAAGWVKPETVYVCTPDGSSGYEMNAVEHALILAKNTIEQLTRELAAVQP